VPRRRRTEPNDDQSAFAFEGGEVAPPKRKRKRAGDPPPQPRCPVFCHTCGQKIRKLNPHRMDKQKVRVLELMAMACVEGHQWVQPLEGGTLKVAGVPRRAPYRARAHASRLVWFGLAKHDDEPRAGLYACTPKGLQFLLGKASVPAHIYCKDGRVLHESPTFVTINEVKDVVLDKDYWDRYGAIQLSG